MKTEDIIDGLNKSIESIRKESNISTNGFFVLHKEILSHPTFKAYKTYKANIWYVINKKKYNVISVEITDKVLDGQEENMNRRLDIELTNKLFSLLYNKFNEIIQGTYAPNRI